MKYIVQDPLFNENGWRFVLSVIAPDDVIYVLPNLYEQSVVVTNDEPEDAFFMHTGIQKEFITDHELEDMVLNALFFYPADVLDETSTDDAFFDYICSIEEEYKPNFGRVNKAIMDWIDKYNTPEDTNCVMKNFKKSWNPDVYFENYWYMNK